MPRELRWQETHSSSGRGRKGAYGTHCPGHTDVTAVCGSPAQRQEWSYSNDRLAIFTPRINSPDANSSDSTEPLRTTFVWDPKLIQQLTHFANVRHLSLYYHLRRRAHLNDMAWHDIELIGGKKKSMGEEFADLFHWPCLSWCMCWWYREGRPGFYHFWAAQRAPCPAARLCGSPSFFQRLGWRTVNRRWWEVSADTLRAPRSTRRHTEEHIGQSNRKFPDKHSLR